MTKLTRNIIIGVVIVLLVYVIWRITHEQGKEAQRQAKVSSCQTGTCSL